MEKIANRIGKEKRKAIVFADDLRIFGIKKRKYRSNWMLQKS